MRKLMQVALADLYTMRIQCGKCGTIVEFETVKLAEQFPEAKCLRCGQAFSSPGKDNHFHKLAEAISHLAGEQNYGKLSFTIDLDRLEDE